ncbi:uncharacterized protein LOC105175701 [Sesamum indicum]|uniref:Uncharacterized protein LOC105175701 n=1 Tax=Sesamum indicum TaxID=4182 RepID=A0A6I9U710_SESIN|nr:uncharacterized protein LOC105175701 [Sesamum indicum]
MSCIHSGACQLACTPSAFPVQAFQLNRTSLCTSIYLGTKLPKISLKLNSSTTRHQRAGIACLFGGKGKSENGNETSPWKALEKAVGNFKKDRSIEDVLRQQIEKQEYYDDGGNDGKRPGGGGGDGDGDYESKDDDLSGMWDEFLQVSLATMAFIFVYIYIIDAEEVTVLAKDLTRYLFRRQQSIRLRRLMNRWKRFFERMKKKEVFDDPYWLEREILNTPTWYDSPAKYRLIARAYLNSRSDI